MNLAIMAKRALQYLVCVTCALTLFNSSIRAETGDLYRQGLAAFNQGDYKSALRYLSEYRQRSQSTIYSDPNFLNILDKAILHCKSELQPKTPTEIESTGTMDAVGPPALPALPAEPPLRISEIDQTQRELSGVYTIQQKSSGRYVDAYEIQKKDHSLVTRPEQNNDTQRWVLTPLGNNTYTIRQKSSGRYVDGDEIREKDHSLVTRPKQNNDTQRWVLTPLDNNTYTIRQKSSGRYVDAHEIQKKDHSLVTRPERGDPTQQWILRKVIR